MRVLSLFDGISCGRVALDRIGIKPSVYFASEIDKSAIAVTRRNWPEVVQCGDVRVVDAMARAGAFGQIDLLMGGSPCQGFSNAGDGLNFDDPRSALFFEYVAIKNAVRPTWFLLENVVMRKEWQDIISQHMGCQPVAINSNKFSAQNRNRLYWTNIPILLSSHQPVPFWSIREWSGDHLKNYKANKTPSRIRMWAGGNGRNGHGECKNVTLAVTANCLTTKQDRTNCAGLVEFEDFCRYLTEIECERLQTLPDNYTDAVSQTARYKMLGNCWTVDVIVHILRGMVA